MWDKIHYNKSGFRIVIYEKENGSRPFYDFIENLDISTKADIFYSIDMLKEKGNSIRAPLSKKIDKCIFELRIKNKVNNCRILYFFCINRTIVITNGFIKKSNRTPKVELDKANRYMNDWIRRNSDGL